KSWQLAPWAEPALSCAKVLCAGNYCIYRLRMGGTERLQTSISGFEFGKAAAFLLEEIKFDSTTLLGGSKDTLPVGTALAEQDLVAFGRIGRPVLQVKRPDPAKGYKVLFGEGSADWKSIFAAAEKGGGVEFYLLEQEGSRFSELETANRCLQSFRTTHA